MTGFDCRSARRRRTTIQAILLIAGLGMATSAFAQQPPAQPAPQTPAPAGQAPAAATPAQPAANPFMFGKDMAILTFYIKPDKTGDFEKVITRLHQALANSDKPERKQQAAGWKVFKGSEPGPSGTVVYVNLISPVLKGADYSIAKIINEVYPAEAQTLFPAYKEAIAGLSRSELDLVADLSGPAPAAPPPAPAAPPQ
jgi:hypothetical protein